MRARISLFFLCLTILTVFIYPGTEDSGGPILPEQAAYDVFYYDINLKIDPNSQSISGYTAVEVLFMENAAEFVLHLQNRFTVSSVKLVTGSNKSELNFTHSNGLLRIAKVISQYELINVEIHYSGQPPAPGGLPWNTGFAWNNNWIDMACEDEGADLWIPCKDHPSDEPDSVSINLTVPSDLVCVANGKERGTTQIDANWTTYHWFVSNPINNYNITFYLSDFEKLSFDYTSTSGDPMPLLFWVRPAYKTKLLNHKNNLLKYIRAMEELCGPYPFRADKFAYVHSSYWGMEHQSAIAYGHNFSTDSYGLDYIAVHELAHEWFGNLVTAKNWRDCWIHEGFATYLEALVAEKLGDNNSYHSYVTKFFQTSSDKAVVPDEDVTASQIFSGQHNIYYKGATILHNLRFLIGDEKIFEFIRKCAYPTSQMETYTDGRQCRLATVDEIIQIANQVAGKDISWYFNTILKTTDAPVLKVLQDQSNFYFQWITSKDQIYNMPLEIIVDGQLHKLEFSNNRATFAASSANPIIEYDPHNWLMKKIEYYVGIEDLNETSDLNLNLKTYPNPFNSQTQISFSLPEKRSVSINIYDLKGSLIKTIVNEELNEASYLFKWDANKIPSGTYFLKYFDSKNSITKKILLIK